MAVPPAQGGTEQHRTHPGVVAVAEPATEPVRLDNLTATIMHTLIDMPQLRLERGIPSDVLQPLFAADPIPQLF